MRRLHRILFAVLTLFLSGRTEVTHIYYLTSSATTRSAALGGAFTAVRDELESCLYNPAALAQSEKKISLAVDPLGLAVVAEGIDRLSVRSSLAPADYLSAAGVVLRSVSFADGPFQATILLSEELPNSPFRDTKTIHSAGKGTADWNHHIAAFRLTPAKQIALGAALLFFNQADSENGKVQMFRSVGASYGILISPSSSLSLGVAVFNIPARARPQMERRYQIDQQDVNFGLSWTPIAQLQLSMDFRKVTQEDSTDVMHFHGGIEMMPLSFLALRAGLFYEEEQRISAGIGLGDFRRMKTMGFIFRKIMLNYSLQTDSPKMVGKLEHRFSLLIRL